MSGAEDLLENVQDLSLESWVRLFDKKLQLDY